MRGSPSDRFSTRSVISFSFGTMDARPSPARISV